MTRIIDGKAIANNTLNKLSKLIQTLKVEHRIIPGLSVIIIGDNAASKLYVKNKQAKAQSLGFNTNTISLPSSVSEDYLLSIIDNLNEDKDVNGILIQLPLPTHLNKNTIMNKINYKKDVDGFHNENIARLVTGDNLCLIPCTPQGCLHLIKTEVSNISGLNAIVIGRSSIVGKPMFNLLLRENCTVTILHSASNNLEKHCSQADLIVSAVGRAKFVKSHWIKPGAIVIDVGINYITQDGKRKLVGDVDFIKDDIQAAAISPVPGGVGPMTITFLMINTIIAACIQHNINYKELLDNYI